MQKQEQDNAWYTCINYIGVSGKPLYGFVPCRQAGDRPSAGLCLRQVLSDSEAAQITLLQASREAASARVRRLRMAVMRLQCSAATPKDDRSIQAGDETARLPAKQAVLCCARCTEQRTPWWRAGASCAWLRAGCCRSAWLWKSRVGRPCCMSHSQPLTSSVFCAPHMQDKAVIVNVCQRNVTEAWNASCCNMRQPETPLWR